MIRPLLLYALLLGACGERNTISGSVTPPPGSDVMLIIRMVPTQVMLDSGHRTGPGRYDTRPFSYRAVLPNGNTVCGATFGDDILGTDPGSFARFQHELDNCRGHGGDFP